MVKGKLPSPVVPLIEVLHWGGAQPGIGKVALGRVVSSWLWPPENGTGVETSVTLQFGTGRLVDTSKHWASRSAKPFELCWNAPDDNLLGVNDNVGKKSDGDSH